SDSQRGCLCRALCRVRQIRVRRPNRATARLLMKSGSPVKGSPVADTRAYTAVDVHTLSFVEKKGTTVTNSGRAVVSPDGKSRTVEATATDSKGMTIKTQAVTTSSRSFAPWRTWS